MRRALAISTTLMMLSAACGSGNSSEQAASSQTATDVVSTTVPPTTTVAPTTTAAPTTTTTVAPTTTTVPITPGELREAFLGELAAAGWVTYVDSVIGWSIMYPGEWSVLMEEPGKFLYLETPHDELGLWYIQTAQDSVPADRGSLDYLIGNVAYMVGQGQLLEPSDDDYFWLDLDFDGERGLVDIEVVQAGWAKNPISGEAFPENVVSPTWQAGYYNPDLRPDYGYMIGTIGLDAAVFEAFDNVVLSFEPPR